MNVNLEGNANGKGTLILNKKLEELNRKQSFGSNNALMDLDSQQIDTGRTGRYLIKKR